MAQALAAGIVRARLAEPQQILASDPGQGGREKFAAAVPGANVTTSNTQVASQAEVVILAVKPQIIDEVLRELGDQAPGGLIVSIAAGVPIARIEAMLPGNPRVVRVMPNTPCLISRGASGYSLGSRATAADGELVRRLLEGVGIAVELPENLLDAVTGLSGSGPAFVYTAIEALTEAGVAEGLPAEVAGLLATHTVAGAAAMVLETGETPGELRDAVTSPGGTTVAGLAALAQARGSEALHAAVHAATQRSKELGNQPKQ